MAIDFVLVLTDCTAVLCLCAAYGVVTVRHLYMIYIFIYLTAIRLTPGGSSTSHIYTQTVHTIQRKENWEVPAVPCLANYTLAFALQLRK
jgi:hypothetical protein